MVVAAGDRAGSAVFPRGVPTRVLWINAAAEQGGDPQVKLPTHVLSINAAAEQGGDPQVKLLASVLCAITT
jgi:hypothetical protein